MHISLIICIYAYIKEADMTTEQTLKMAVESLTKVNDMQSRQLEAQSAQLAEMSQRIKELTAQLAYFQRRMFGRSSEKNLNLDNQPSLFDAAGVEIPGEEPAPAAAEQDGPDAGKSNPKGKKHHRINIDNLPVLETRVIKPEHPVDLTRYRLMGYEETFRLGFQPGKL